MNLQARDRRALAMLGLAAVLSAIIYFWPTASVAVVAPVTNSVPAAEARVRKLREIIATIPGKQKVADGLAAQLKEREKGLIEAETGAQAQAQLLQIVRKLARSQSPPIDIGANELGSITALGKDYGETSVAVSMNCRIEQLVNLLADISSQPEAIATNDLRINAADPRQKTLNVRLSISAVLPRKLVPERRGPAI
ncbi:MAG: type II secretion system protein GspM [Bryobacteraceae bacterium]